MFLRCEFCGEGFDGVAFDGHSGLFYCSIGGLMRCFRGRYQMPPLLADLDSLLLLTVLCGQRDDCPCGRCSGLRRSDVSYCCTKETTGSGFFGSVREFGCADAYSTAISTFGIVAVAES